MPVPGPTMMTGVRGSSGKWKAWACLMTDGTRVPISILFSQVEQTPLCLGPRPSATHKYGNTDRMLKYGALTSFLEGNNSNSNVYLIGVHLG